MIAIPRPVPQTRMARSTSPAATPRGRRARRRGSRRRPRRCRSPRPHGRRLEVGLDRLLQREPGDPLPPRPASVYPLSRAISGDPGEVAGIEGVRPTNRPSTPSLASSLRAACIDAATVDDPERPPARSLDEPRRELPVDPTDVLRAASRRPDGPDRLVGHDEPARVRRRTPARPRSTWPSTTATRRRRDPARSSPTQMIGVMPQRSAAATLAAISVASPRGPVDVPNGRPPRMCSRGPRASVRRRRRCGRRPRLGARPVPPRRSPPLEALARDPQRRERRQDEEVAVVESCATASRTWRTIVRPPTT